MVLLLLRAALSPLQLHAERCCGPAQPDQPPGPMWTFLCHRWLPRGVGLATAVALSTFRLRTRCTHCVSFLKRLVQQPPTKGPDEMT